MRGAALPLAETVVGDWTVLPSQCRQSSNRIKPISRRARHSQTNASSVSSLVAIGPVFGSAANEASFPEFAQNFIDFGGDGWSYHAIVCRQL